MVGAKYLARNVDALAVNGRLVVIGLQGGVVGGAEPRRAARQARAPSPRPRCARPVDEKAAIVAAVREHVWPLIEAGAVRPVVDRTLPIAEAAEAHRVVEASTHVGKVLLTM